MFDFLIHFTVKAHHMVMKYEEKVVFLSLLALSPLLDGPVSLYNSLFYISEEEK